MPQPMYIIIIIIIIIIIRVFFPRKGPWLQTQEPRSKFCSKAGLPLQTREPRLKFYQGLNRCGSFPLLSTPHSLLSIWTDPRGTNMEVRRVDLTKWTLRTSPKFTTGIKYQFIQDFWAHQRSGNPNHLRPYILYSLLGLDRCGSFPHPTLSLAS